jgi:hypothetical protein
VKVHLLFPDKPNAQICVSRLGSLIRQPSSEQAFMFLHIFFMLSL